MLKTIRSPNNPISGINDTGKSASNRNKDNKSIFWKNNNDSKINGFSINNNGIKYIKK